MESRQRAFIHLKGQWAVNLGLIGLAGIDRNTSKPVCRGYNSGRTELHLTAANELIASLLRVRDPHVLHVLDLAALKVDRHFLLPFAGSPRKLLGGRRRRV